MISPELLRRYPFFSFLTPEQQRTVAMMADEVTVPAGHTLFHSGEPAPTFYLLMEAASTLITTSTTCSRRVRKRVITWVR
jgi:CRP-like cAMP-binding protein